MRLAVTILGLVFAAVLGVAHSVLLVLGLGYGDPSVTLSGLGGVVVATFVLVGGAFAIPYPTVASASFALAAVAAPCFGIAADNTRMYLFALVALALAVLAWFGAREKRAPSRVA